MRLLYQTQSAAVLFRLFLKIRGYAAASEQLSIRAFELNAVDWQAQMLRCPNAQALAAKPRGTVSLVRKPCNRPNCPLCKSGEKHQALIYTCRVDGVGKCFHVRPEDEKLMRKAVENARKLEALLASEGLKYLDILRGED